MPDPSDHFLARSLQALQENVRRSGPAASAGYTLIGAIPGVDRPALAAVFSSKPEERNRLTALIAEKNGHLRAALNEFVEESNTKQNGKHQ